MSFVIAFDMPSSLRTERRRITRELNRNAVKVQDSFWGSDNLKFLVDVGSRIRKLGGRAEILEEKFLF